MDCFKLIEEYLGGSEGKNLKFLYLLRRYKKYCDKQYFEQPIERRYDEYNVKKFLNFLTLSIELELLPFNNLEERKQFNRCINISFEVLNVL